MDIMLFKKRLKEAREKAGLRQNELADISGVTNVTVSAYESTDGKRGMNPSLSNVEALAKALHVSLDWLCGIKTNNNEIESRLRSLSEFIDSNAIEFHDGYFCFSRHLSRMYSDFVREYKQIKSIKESGLASDEMIDVLKQNIISKYVKLEEKYSEEEEFLNTIENDPPF